MAFKPASKFTKFGVAAAAIVLSAAAMAQAPAQQLRSAADPKIEERARLIGKELRCVVCQNQSIDDSDAPLARDLVSRTRVSRLLAGYRDRPPANADAIDAVLIALSDLAADIPEVAELDINPLLVLPSGCIGLDALIVPALIATHRLGASDTNRVVLVTLMLAMIRYGQVTRASSLLFLVPPGSALFAWLILGEPMPPLAWIGMIVAGIGVWIVNAKRAKA